MKSLKNRIETMLNLVESNTQLCIKKSRILDFGCHDGAIVNLLRNENINISGVDLSNGKDKSFLEQHKSNHVKYAELKNYRIPYEDNSFDLIISHHVFEHVMDYETTLQELSRVLKKNGKVLNVFPSKWRLFEAHFYTPLGGVFHNTVWCRLWALVGIKKPGKKHFSSTEYGSIANSYISDQTNYIPKQKILTYFQKYFRHNDFLEDKYYECLNSTKIITPLKKLYQIIISHFHVRVILSSKE